MRDRSARNVCSAPYSGVLPASWLLGSGSWLWGFRGMGALLSRAEIDLAALVGVEEIAEANIDVLEENALEFERLTGLGIENAALEQAGRRRNRKFERGVLGDETAGGKVQIEGIGREPGQASAIENRLPIIPGKHLCAARRSHVSDTGGIETIGESGSVILDRRQSAG